MKDKNSRQNKRIKKLIVGCTFAAIVLIASTYAWFIGMKTVNVSSFDVTIATTDGLSLSLDGKKWLETVAISESNYNDTENTVYTGHTNSWGGEGLIPMSSVGVINTTTSKLELYEKGSLTATHGGYRILASQVEQTASKEGEGYVAFDLFIKNLSGEEYYATNNPENEEAIYLTTDSAVTVASAGANASTGDEAGVGGTGIENSVRVAFAQIARVEGTTTDQETITGMNCNSSDSKITKICNQRTAQIWEPNDTAHVQNAINWYTTSCVKRVSGGDDVTEESSYSGTCGEFKNGTAYPTYAIATVIDDENTNVDIYDGEAYNSYTGSSAFLQSFDYFTDTEKNLHGMARPTFFTLAPNSITKVRVYVWIEGQDVDNYDFAQLGSAISVNFGFTKERFTDKDVNYSDAGTATLPDDVIGNY